MSNIIETENLTKFYGSARGIDSLALTVREGDVFGLIGPNGAGKSIALKMPSALAAPASGGDHCFWKACCLGLVDAKGKIAELLARTGRGMAKEPALAWPASKVSWKKRAAAPPQLSKGRC